MEPNIMPPKIPFFRATRAPERKASSPPVMAPATIWLKASYFFLRAIIAQSVAENSPAQMAKLPACEGYYLRGWVLFFWGAWCRPWRVSAWGRTTCPWGSRTPRRLCSRGKNRYRSRRRCGRDRVARAYSFANHLNYIMYNTLQLTIHNNHN